MNDSRRFASSLHDVKLYTPFIIILVQQLNRCFANPQKDPKTSMLVEQGRAWNMDEHGADWCSFAGFPAVMASHGFFLPPNG